MSGLRPKTPLALFNQLISKASGKPQLRCNPQDGCLFHVTEVTIGTGNVDQAVKQLQPVPRIGPTPEIPADRRCVARPAEAGPLLGNLERVRIFSCDRIFLQAEQGRKVLKIINLHKILNWGDNFLHSPPSQNFAKYLQSKTL